jgi:hypothetical protein
MFAMKRVILAAAFVFAISGIAAAQSTSTKPASKKQEKTTVKKVTPAKINSPKSTVLKEEASANAKSDSSVKLVLPMPKLSFDSTEIPPVVKNEKN